MIFVMGVTMLKMDRGWFLEQRFSTQLIPPHSQSQMARQASAGL